jgi:hypothetical protein
MTTDMLASLAHLFIKFLSGDRTMGLASYRDRVAPILHFRWLWRTLRGSVLELQHCRREVKPRIYTLHKSQIFLFFRRRRFASLMRNPSVR